LGDIDGLNKKYVDVCDDLLQGEFNTKGRQIITEIFDIIKTYRSEAFTFTSKEEKIILAQGEILSTNLFYLYLQQTGIPSVLLNA
jgi:aspartate kinase